MFTLLISLLQFRKTKPVAATVTLKALRAADTAASAYCWEIGRWGTSRLDASDASAYGYTTFLDPNWRDKVVSNAPTEG